MTVWSDNAARFATRRPEHLAMLRRATINAAMELLLAGDRDAAYQAMLLGVAAQDVAGRGRCHLMVLPGGAP